MDFVTENLKIYDQVKSKNSEGYYTAIATFNDFKSGKLLALATGTKANLRKLPDDIEDCHAESLVQRAFKRHLVDKIGHVISSYKNSNIAQESVEELIKRECQLDLTFFVSQFPCGFIKRYEGDEPVDSHGNIIERKPGRGLVQDGKTVYVEKSCCFKKLKKWSKTGVQGKRIKEVFNICCKIRRIVIGNCEVNSEFDYEFHINRLQQELSCDISLHNNVRRDEFVFDSSKIPQPVAVVYWDMSYSVGGSVSPKRLKSGDRAIEYIVNGRKRGSTQKQCSRSQLYKLKVANDLFKQDLNSIEKNYLVIKSHTDTT